MELFWRLAQGSVVLLDEVPADLILREIAVPARCACLTSARGDGVGVGGALVLVLVIKVAVGRHLDG